MLSLGIKDVKCECARNVQLSSEQEFNLQLKVFRIHKVF